MKRIILAALCCIVVCVSGCAGQTTNDAASPVEIAEIDVAVDALDLSEGQRCELYDVCGGTLLLGICEADPSNETEPPYFRRFVFYDTADGTVRDLPFEHEGWLGSAIVFYDGVLFSFAPGDGALPSIRCLSADGAEREVYTVDYAPAGAAPTLARFGDAALFIYDFSDGSSYGITQVNADFQAVPLLAYYSEETDRKSDNVYVSGTQYVSAVSEEGRAAFYITASDGATYRFSLREGEDLYSCIPAGNTLIVSQEYTEDGKTVFSLVRYDLYGNVLETYPLDEPLRHMYINDDGILLGEPYGMIADAPPFSVYDTNGALTPIALPSDADGTDMGWRRCFVDGKMFLLTPWSFDGAEENRILKVTCSAE